MPKAAPKRGVEKFLHDNEFEIRARLKDVHHKNSFSVTGVKTTQTSRFNRLSIYAEIDDGVVAAAFHPSWHTVDVRRASAACPFEQMRARAWGLGELRQSFETNFETLHHLTFADAADQRREGELGRFKLDTFRRKLRRAFSILLRDYPNLQAFGIVEVSAHKSTDDTIIFEPHSHILVDGAPEQAVRSAFNGIVKSRSAHLHPIQLEPVLTASDLTGVLGYMFKQVIELRPRLVDRLGRSRRGRDNLLTGSGEIECLAWLAAIRVSELLIAVGPPAKMLQKFDHRELQPIFEKLLHYRQ
jgi:hypothetical protein